MPTKDNFQNSLLYTAMKSLNKEGIREFDNYIKSPFFNKNKEIIAFWDILSSFLQKNDSQINKKSLHRALFPKLEYKDSRLRLLMSDLYIHFENYLMHIRISEDFPEVTLSALKYFRQQGMVKHFNKKIKSLEKKNEEKPIRNENYFSYRAGLTFEQYHFQFLQKRSSTAELQDSFHFTDYAFIISKLRHACLLASHKAVYKTEIEIDFLSEVLSFIEKRELNKYPAIAIYYNCYKLMENVDAKYFNEYRELIKDSIHVLDEEETREVFLIGINYCIKLINKGNSEMSAQLLELFELGLAGDHLLVNGFLSRFTFRNIVTIGLINKDYSWVEKFIYDFKPKLEEKHRESMFIFNLALLKYEQKEFDEVQGLLYKSDYKDLLLSLFAKAILLKVYYEKKDLKLLESHLDAMEIFIRRKKIIGYHRRHYMNIIRFTRKMIKLNPYDNQAKEKLLKEVESSDSIAEKKWLLKQLE